jgi:hypothetical protein
VPISRQDTAERFLARKVTHAAVEQMFADFCACKRKIWPRIKISRAHVTAGRVLWGYIKWLRVSALNPFKSPFMCSAVFSPLSVSRHLIKLALNYVVIGIDFAAAPFFVRLLSTHRESAKKTKLTKTHARLFIPSPPPLLYIHNLLCRSNSFKVVCAPRTSS